MKNKKKTTKKFSKFFSERLSIIEWNSGFLRYFFTLLLYYVFQYYFFLYIALKCHNNFCCTVNISCSGQWKKASSWTQATSGTDLIFLYLFLYSSFCWPGLIFILFLYYSNHNFILTFILVPFSVDVQILLILFICYWNEFEENKTVNCQCFNNRRTKTLIITMMNIHW